MKPQIALDSNVFLELLSSKISSLEPVRAQEIKQSPLAFVFGSWAANLQKPSSDLDLLIVSEANSHWRENGLDVVSITPSMLNSQSWQSGELATHIASYGIQIKGTSGSLTISRPSEAAALGKRRRIIAYLKALEGRWSRFDSILKKKYINKIYLDVLRLGLLEKGIAVPPTALLKKTAIANSLNPTAKLKDISLLLPRAFIKDLSGGFPKLQPLPDKNIVQRQSAVVAGR